MGEKTLRTKLSALYFIVFGAPACYYPFLTIYFREKGLSYTEIGLALALNSLTAVICQPVWGYITDRYFYKKKTIIIVCLGSAAAVYSLIFANSFYSVLLSIMLYMMFQSSTGSISDALCYEIIDQHKDIHYGRIRLMGSFGYAVIALVLGMIIKAKGINITFVIYSIIIVIGVFILFSIDFKGRQNESRLNLKDILKLIRDKRFVIFISSICIINISMGANGNYIAILIEKTGGDVSNLGMLWFIVAMSELPVLFMGNRLTRKYGELNLYLMSLILYVLRYFLDSICLNYNVVILVQVMQSITFTLYLISSMNYLNSILPKQMKAIGMTIYAAIGGGLGGLIGNMGGGMLLEHLSIFSLYKILSITTVLALGLGAALKRYE